MELEECVTAGLNHISQTGNKS